MTSIARFAIGLEPDEPHVGRIVIGDFTETFTLEGDDWSDRDYEASWRTALTRLLRTDPSTTALMTWYAAAPATTIQRGWILYREGDRVFVQERMMVPGENEARFDEHGQLVAIEPRETHTEDGEPISEWETSCAAIQAFLNGHGTT